MWSCEELSKAVAIYAAIMNGSPCFLTNKLFVNWEITVLFKSITFIYVLKFYLYLFVFTLLSVFCT